MTDNENTEGCAYCTIDTTGHGRIKNSYDDYDGMIMCIHPSEIRPNGTRSLAYWLAVGFRGETRQFLIECCPFCGKRLVPKIEEIGEVTNE